MASTSAVSMAVPLTHSSQRRVPISDAFFKLLPIRPSKAAAAIVLMASMVIPEVAEEAESGISPSLKNFLLSIVAGGAVLGVIAGAVIGVANFDPVKRT
ncbi:hypothetical protein SLE2022_162460 [Rubroshorea leprosula]